MVRTTATVLRRGPGNIGAVQEEIPIEELVPGDVVFLAAGDLVPADVRLLASRDLFISQSILSGESLPVEKYDVMADVAGKDSEQLPDKDKSLLDLGNICLMGTNVTSGRAQAVVVATGSRTVRLAGEIHCGYAYPDGFRSRSQQRELAVDTLYADHGAGCPADQWFQ